MITKTTCFWPGFGRVALGSCCLRGVTEKNQEGHPEPWATFATKMAVGMGQMETKVFPATFPEDFEVRTNGTGLIAMAVSCDRCNSDGKSSLKGTGFCWLLVEAGADISMES